MSWEAAWEESRTPWDAGEAHPALRRLIAEGGAPRGSALVPGAGSAYEAHLLADAGWDVLAVDIAPRAVQRARHLWDGRDTDATGRFRAECADFFALDGEFDLIWDYTFLCAIEPGMRDAWSASMRRLLAAEGTLVTLVFPVVERDTFEATGDEGPPYPMRPELVRSLLEPWARASSLAPTDSNHVGREGKEWLGTWHHAERS